MVAIGVVLATLALQLPGSQMQSRRELLVGAAAAFALPSNAAAYDTIAPVTADFDEMERKRKAREEMLNKNRAEIKPYLNKVSSSTTPAEYSDAVDELVLWMIGKGKLPEGIDALSVRDTIQDTWESLPQKAYACEMTRTNKGVCYSPGEPADGAYYAAITELRKYATRKGKGSLMSDGVSAANSAAF